MAWQLKHVKFQVSENPSAVNVHIPKTGGCAEKLL